MSRDTRHSLEEADDRNLTSAAPQHVAIVVGADTRLGRYTTVRLRTEGWLVATVGAPASSPADDPQFAIEPHDDDAMRDAVHSIVAQVGPPSLLVTTNDVPAESPFCYRGSASWAPILDHVVRTSLTACRAVIPAMRDLGGTVLAISPAPDAGGAHYTAAHYTLLGMMRSLAIETAQDNVNVNLLTPVLGDIFATASSPAAINDALSAIGDTATYLASEGTFLYRYYIPRSSGSGSPHRWQEGLARWTWHATVGP